MGTGGVGGYYGGEMARAGHEVCVLARGANLDAIRSGGLQVRMGADAWRADVTAADDAAAFGAVDLAVVSVKSYALSSVTGAVRTLAESGAVVLPLLNGVDAVDQLIGGGVPRAQVIGGVTYVSAVRVAPGQFERRSPIARIAIGELDTASSERVTRIATALHVGNVEAHVVPNIVLTLWQKFVFIASLAAVCGLARSSLGPLRAMPLGWRTLERAVREGVAVGRARGVGFAADEADRILTQIAGLPESIVPSFVLDVRAGGETELDALSGAIARMAQETGLETPVHDAVASTLFYPPPESL